MQVYEAKQLIAKAYINLKEPQHWLDLGCGSGTFTRALAQLLPPHSCITAVDLENQSLPAEAGENVRIDFKQGDLQYLKIRERVHGILMANSLHYIRDQVIFLEQLRQISAYPILVEYDTKKANPWVPFPIPFEKVKTLMPQGSILKQIGKMHSRYQSGGMYAAEVWF